jgi:predicted RNA-binding Zn-ribbon protein involved in translation (DUF1610 family)
MDLIVEQSCPSCGADIVGDEAGRLLQCPFCGVRHYRVTSGLSRFILPDKAPAHIPREELLYAPYLHFKGSIFSCNGRQLRQGVVDVTHLGAGDGVPGLPISLGLRPQAMPVSLLALQIPGNFFRQGLKVEAIFELAAQSSAAVPEQNPEPLYHRAFIGETISCLYLPLYIVDRTLYDAVTNRPLARGVSGDDLGSICLPFQKQWIPRFLATLCPACGASLAGETESLVLSCHTCHSSWEETEGVLRSLAWQRVASPHKDARYLPFWKIEVRTSGVALESFGDFLRLTNQPLVVRPEHDRMALCFWVPAFKIRPQVFLNLARNLTSSQKRLPAGEAVMADGLFPVTLPRSEAIQALKTVLAEAAVNKQDVLPLLPGISFQPLATELVYLPFNNKGHDWVQEQILLAIPGPVLRFGRSL